MKNLPYISILIPVYNVELYICRCIQSVMAQTYNGQMECIIIDDCGTDRSIEIAEQLVGEYNGKIEFRILHHENNRGLAAARNTAVDASRGDFIIHVDSDDWVEPGLVEELVQRQEETDADIVSCNFLNHYSDREVIFEEPDCDTKDEWMRIILQRNVDQSIWRRLIRASLYKDNNISAVEGVNIGEDYYTLPRLLYYAKSSSKCDKVLYHYNCINVTSYMNANNPTHDVLRCRNDIQSFGILIDFFVKRGEQKYLDEVNMIKAHYIYASFPVVLKKNNRVAYDELCESWNYINEPTKRKLGVTRFRDRLLTPKYYCLNRMRVMSRRILKKITGIKFNV